jgi:hypothetical protein
MGVGMLNLNQLAEMIGLTAGILVGFWLIWRHGVRPIVKFVRTLVRAADALEEAVPTLREIAVEFQPNDGKSLVDRMGRMDRNIQVTNENVANVHHMVASFEGVDPNFLVPLKPLEETPSE